MCLFALVHRVGHGSRVAAYLSSPGDIRLCTKIGKTEEKMGAGRAWAAASEAVERRAFPRIRTGCDLFLFSSEAKRLELRPPFLRR